MIHLHLSPSELAGATKIADWLDELVEAEGDDRPTFAAIANYLSSDIRDVIEADTPPWARPEYINSLKGHIL